MILSSPLLSALNRQLQFVTYTNTVFHPKTADTGKDSILSWYYTTWISNVTCIYSNLQSFTLKFSGNQQYCFLGGSMSNQKDTQRAQTSTKINSPLLSDELPGPLFIVLIKLLEICGVNSNQFTFACMDLNRCMMCVYVRFPSHALREKKHCSYNSGVVTIVLILP